MLGAYVQCTYMYTASYNTYTRSYTYVYTYLHVAIHTHTVASYTYYNAYTYHVATFHFAKQTSLRSLHASMAHDFSDPLQVTITPFIPGHKILGCFYQ